MPRILANAGQTASNLAVSRDHDVRVDDEFARISQFISIISHVVRHQLLHQQSTSIERSPLICSDPHMRLPITLPTVQKSIRTSSLPNRFATNRFLKSQLIYQSRAMASSMESLWAVPHKQYLILIQGTSDLNIENTNIKTASGVSLDDHQKTLVGSVLDVSFPVV